MSKSKCFRQRMLSGLSLGTVFAAMPAAAQTQDARSDVLEEVVVMAEGSRLPANIDTVPGSVTLVDAEQIQAQAAISSDLGRILASSVPGMSLSSNDGNNFSQTLRGRKPAFFIDGIPQSAELRGGGRDLRIIHPNALERVEVINGATSIYGLGGSGGVVNYITKRPTNGGLEWFSDVGLSGSLSHMSAYSMEYTLAQGLSARGERADAIANITYQTRGLFYDGDGDPIPPDPTGQTGIADMTEWSFFGKAGYDFTPDVRLEVMGMHYDAEVDTDYTVRQGSFINGVKSIAERKRSNNIVLFGGQVAFDFLGVDPSSHNTLAASTLIVENLLNSTWKLQGYYKDSEFVWRHLDFIPAFPTSAGFPPDGSQLITQNQKTGARLDILTPLGAGNLLWGVDYSVDETFEKLVDGRVRTSNIEQDSLSFFAQLQYDLTPRLHVRGGARFDDFKLTIPDFMALDFFSAAVSHRVIGAELDYDNVSGNLGLVFDLTDHLNVFASWSQGFSVGNVIRTISGLRPTTPGPQRTYDVANLGLFIEPITVDSYETGVRYRTERTTASLTAFYNESDLGATFDPITLQTVRAPERIWGAEAALSGRVLDRLRLGASYVWMDSETDSNNDGNFDGPLDFGRVPPPLATAYAELEVRDGWQVRLQSTTLFSEKRFKPPFGQSQRDVKGYTIVDLLVTGAAFGGTVSFGVENLFNRQYYPLITYMGCANNPLFDSFCATAAPGARGSLRYSRKY